jgi:hypothetical protein
LIQKALKKADSEFKDRYQRSSAPKVNSGTSLLIAIA